jgi:hypothetical protein
MDAIMRSIPSDIDRILQQKIEAWKKRYLSSEERTTICRVPPVACSDNSEDNVITSEESSEEMEATNLEATPEETEAPVERQDLFKEQINVDNIGSLEDRCKEQHLDVRRRRGAKKRSQDSVGSRQKVSAAHKRVIRRAIPAVRKGNIRKGPGKDGSVRRAPKGRRLQKTHRISPECNIGIRNRGPKDQLHLRMKRTSDRVIRSTSELTSLFYLFIAEKLMRTHFGRSGHCRSARRMC